MTAEEEHRVVLNKHNRKNFNCHEVSMMGLLLS